MIKQYFEKKQICIHILLSSNKSVLICKLWKLYDKINNTKYTCSSMHNGSHLHKWARSYFPGNKYNILIAKIIKCINAVLQDVKLFRNDNKVGQYWTKTIFPVPYLTGEFSTSSLPYALFIGKNGKVRFPCLRVEWDGNISN